MKPGIELITLAIVFAGALLGCATTGGNASLAGDWTCVSAVINGKPLPEATTQLLHLRLTQDRFTTTKGTETLFDSVYRLDMRANPHRIFMMGNEGDATGKEAQGIYKLEGESLTLCYAMPGDPAPTAFLSAPDSKAYLVVWKRATK